MSLNCSGTAHGPQPEGLSWITGATNFAILKFSKGEKMKKKKTSQTLSYCTVWHRDLRPCFGTSHSQGKAPPPTRPGEEGRVPVGAACAREGGGTRPHRNRREQRGGAGGVSVRPGGAGAAGERLWYDPSVSLTCAAPARSRWRRIQRRIREQLWRRRRRAGKGPRATPARPSRQRRATAAPCRKRRKTTSSRKSEQPARLP